MKTSRTPLRLSLLGGGSDYPQFFCEHGGAILGTTINAYCYVSLHEGQAHHFFDLPNKSGLGSSSAYTVGLLRVCTDLSKETIARLATTWEWDKMGGNVGYQDQWLCALGGFHYMRFSEQDVRDTLIPSEMVAPLLDYLMLFNTHQYRRASDLVKYMLAELKEHQETMCRIADMPKMGVEALQKGDYEAFGPLLDEAWQLKRQQSKYISTPEIDAIYEKAKSVGATGGKLLGGGGGGFMVFFVPKNRQEDVKKALAELTWTPFKFETEGTKVLYHDS